MMCQYCNQNEATRRFALNMMGQHREVHLCEECTQRLSSQGGHPITALQNSITGHPGLVFSPAIPNKNTAESDNFPQNAGSEIQKRRHINQLRSKLNEAVKQEKFEEAAMLRDTIMNEEKGTYAHD